MKKPFKLEVLGGETNCAGGLCPTIYRGSDGEFYVQGYVVEPAVKIAAKFGANEDVVRISPELIKLIKKL